MRKISFFILLLAAFLILPKVSDAQIIKATGNITEASSQLILYYDNEDTDTQIQVTNTNDTESVWIHVQIFRSFDPDDAGPIDPTICDERDFVDLLTPNDTHNYDIGLANFPRNIGETQATAGGLTSLSDQLNETLGFVVITPIVSEVDFTAISFQNMIGNSNSDDEDFVINAMGRDAVDFTTGDVVPDGTPLDGITNGFIVLQPFEFQFHFGTDTFPLPPPNEEVHLVGIAFSDHYGDPGLLGYQVLPC